MEKNDFLREIVAGLFIAVLIISYLWLAFNYFSTENNQPKYEMEMWHDNDTGITMRIFKDKTGDVLYCEPVEVEMEER